LSINGELSFLNVFWISGFRWLFAHPKISKKNPQIPQKIGENPTKSYTSHDFGVGNCPGYWEFGTSLQKYVLEMRSICWVMLKTFLDIYQALIPRNLGDIERANSDL
jgi:hypothetical protein